MKYFESLIQQITQGETTFYDMFQNYDIVNTINQEFLISYDIRDGETLQDVALQFYDDPQLWWLICLTNNIQDPFFDIAKSDEYVQQEAIEYASINPVFWEDDAELFWDYDTELFWYDQEDYIEEYEAVTIENELKRRIDIIAPRFLPDVISQILEKANEV